MRPLTMPELRRLRELSEAGVCMSEAARLISRSPSCVRHWAKLEALPFSKWTRRKLDDPPKPPKPPPKLVTPKQYHAALCRLLRTMRALKAS